ncbi:hypothetical protein A8C75_11640 [Marinobacterium aestuarii]|uniref:Sigma-54 factor interaction domain-containing protein n=1 Tax=Marinobacterium aestuarii TaxID=1821621 RepID=A0A1A9EZ92_9GAMM|nr:sigma 54-interacting transcriptional regulator [Marinobacterium aestuarii]ANG63060.1 hypothetical protein A8C75_11640 [Marinobacterium aestuarii]
MKKQILLTWLGKHDLDAEAKNQLGPVASILLGTGWPFDEARILVNDWFDEVPRYEAWLKRVLKKEGRSACVFIRCAELRSPIDYPGIYAVAREELGRLASPERKITLNLTSGTPAMIATWLLLGKGVFGAKLVQTSLQQGLSVVDLPFDISLEYLQQQDGILGSIASATPGLNAHFEHIQTASPAMQECVELAKRLAVRDVPVIIQGETGTGKEVMAEALHQASLRNAKPFIAVNCGAIPESLLDSQLFGHVKGAFTGATGDRKGYFEEADGGVLFLDEIGELPLEAQAKLLRALQQKEITRVGDSKPRKVDIRVIAATHRDLLSMVEDGSFREDLFYRLAVGVLHIPALRERIQDMELLVEALLANLNQEAQTQPGYVSKEISKNGIKFIKAQRWPGNIRELWNTLVRASIWSDDQMLDAIHLEKALIRRPDGDDTGALRVDVSGGIDINKIIEKTKRYCIEEAFRVTAGQKGKAAKLLGLSNHQTLTNWMKQLGMEEQ